MSENLETSEISDPIDGVSSIADSNILNHNSQLGKPAQQADPHTSSTLRAWWRRRIHRVEAAQMPNDQRTGPRLTIRRGNWS